ncbi:MAG: hypothetical protein Q4G35_03935 [Propionibacteriaceae bacterium]|nr:hypothetical protein [Propionibacteriaceae bacterium]
MTTSNAIQFQVVGTPSRRVVAVSPAVRPELRLPQAHPARVPAPGRIGSVASCAVSRPQARSPWMIAKVVVVGVLAIVGGAVSTAQLVGDVISPDPSFEYVAGDPAWAHVTQP